MNLKILERITQWLACLVYMTTVGALVIPVVTVNVAYHAVIDVWAICEGHLVTSRGL